MAIYHLEAKVVSRGIGRSAVAASAYLSCSNMYNDYDGIQHDYTRKHGLVHQEVMLPPHAPPEWADREKLWNAVEETEKTKDSRLAREFVPALPIELNKGQCLELLHEFIQENFVDMGMCADFAIHDTNRHNPHAHILLTVRPLNEDGSWQYKTEKEYLCIKNGEEQGFTAAEFKAAQADGWEKQYQYKVGRKKIYMTPSAAQEHGYERFNKHPKSTKFGRQNPITEQWNSEEQLLQWRANWAEATNKVLERYGINERVDHRSFAERGLTEQPTIHEGVSARMMEKKGLVAERCEINRQIKAENALLQELKAQVKKLADAVKNSIPELANALEGLRENMIVLVYRIRHIRTGKQRISDYIDAVKPDIDRYAEIKKEIKEKTAERKQLRTEQNALSFVHVLKHQKLSEQITTLTEDIEELKSEKSMILKFFECTDDTAFHKIKKNVEKLETQKGTLKQAEVKFTAELDATQKEFASLHERTVDVDPVDLYDARQAIRPAKEQNAVCRIQDVYGDKYKIMAMLDSKRNVSLMLDEYVEDKTIQQMKRERQRKFPTEQRQTQLRKKRDDWELL